MNVRCLLASGLVGLVASAGCGGDFTSKNMGGNGGASVVDGGSDAPSGSTGSAGGSLGSGGRPSMGGTQGTAGGTTGSGGHPSSGGRIGSGGRSGGTGGSNTGGDVVDAGSGGTSDGAGGSGSGGTGGTTIDGGAGSGGVGACTSPTAWYVDADRDGYGSAAKPKIISCDPPTGRYTKVGGDCDDDNADVHPQITAQEKQYFDTPYQTPDGIESFDYDCSGKEEGDPGVSLGAKTCPTITLNGSCGGSGYLSIGVGGRMNANGYCGSTSYRTCTPSLTFCQAQDSTNFPTAYRCK